MKEIIDKSGQVLAFLIKTTAYQGHSSQGTRMSICVPQKSVQAISDLSNIVGRMEVYEAKGDKENFDYMTKFFHKTCDKYDVDMDEFEDWLVAENEMETPSEDNCEICTTNE